jgi:dihydropteroate synthase
MPQRISSLMINDRVYDFSRTYVMGIINITPDSFSRDGLYSESKYVENAILQAQTMIAAGADFLDVGAESTRPGAAALSATEEGRRLFPVLRELVRAVTIPISVDTYKPEIATQAIELGAAMINDIWGLKAPGDPGRRMAEVIAQAQVPVILMHNQAQPGYQHLIRDVMASLNESIAIASRAGIDPGKIIVDPGIGASFGKTVADDLKLLQNLQQLKVLGKPILLGTSRKSVIGKVLDLPVEERLEGTIATNVWGVANGANIVRVHDVQAISRAIRMCDAIMHE